MKRIKEYLLRHWVVFIIFGFLIMSGAMIALDQKVLSYSWKPGKVAVNPADITPPVAP